MFLFVVCVKIFVAIKATAGKIAVNFCCGFFYWDLPPIQGSIGTQPNLNGHNHFDRHRHHHRRHRHRHRRHRHHRIAFISFALPG